MNKNEKNFHASRFFAGIEELVAQIEADILGASGQHSEGRMPTPAFALRAIDDAC